MRILRCIAPVFLISLATAVADEKAELLAIGRQQYAACMTCHGPDGKGMKVGDVWLAPSLADSAYLKADDASTAALIVLKGIEKPKNSEFIQQMIGLEQAFDDKKIAAVLTYVRSEFAGRDDLVTSKQASQWREEFKTVGALVSKKYLAAIDLMSGLSGRIDDLTYKAYDIGTNKLPDFSKLTPAHQGEWKNGILDLNAAGKLKKGSFALVFEGNLMVEKTGQYQFLLGSDDGSRLFVDGEVEILNDGIHGLKIVESKPQELIEGIHSLRIEYFEASGGEELVFAVKAAGTDVTVPLSVQKLDGKSVAKAPLTPIPLLSRATNEAVLYRNFITDSQPRGIAVGYPGGHSLCWDADTFNLVHLWRGDFMDASRHWTGRGQGSQPPMGIDVALPAKGLPLQVLESPDTPWVDYSTATIKYNKDDANPQKEITYNSPHKDYQFLGYRLDENRFPTFRFRYQDMEVEDFFTPVEIEGRSHAIRRTIRFKGKPAAHTSYRIAKGGSLEENGELVSGPVTIRVERSEPRKHADNWVVPVEADFELVLTYRWNNPSE